MLAWSYELEHIKKIFIQPEWHSSVNVSDQYIYVCVSYDFSLRFFIL